MALTMLDKTPVAAAKTAWPPEISAEFEREKKSPNGCVGKRLLSENERVRVWDIKLAPGERFGFHRHVLDYFWSCSTGGKARAHLDDGTVVEHIYTPGETRHESHAKGHFKVHDLKNTGPYMHNGAFRTLEDVVRFYDTQSTIRPLNLTDDEVADLVAYLETL